VSPLSRNELKYLSSLQQKKYRQEHQQCIIEGIRLCEDALRSEWQLHEFFVTGGFRENDSFHDLAGLAGEQHLNPSIISESEMQKITATRTPQGVALLADIPATQALKPDPERSPQLVLLDGISDPGNLGTIMRSADWFGIRHLAMGPGTVEWTNPKVLRASMGAAFRLTISEIHHWKKQLTTLKSAGYTILAAEMDGINPREFDREQCPRWGLILGNEAHGVSPHLNSAANVKLSIPGDGPADSLNVAMAGTVLLYELSQ